MSEHRELIEAFLGSRESIKDLYKKDEESTIAFTNLRLIEVQHAENSDRNEATITTTSLGDVTTCSLKRCDDEEPNKEGLIWAGVTGLIGALVLLMMLATDGPLGGFDTARLAILLILGLIAIVIAVDAFDTDEGYVSLKLESGEVNEKVRLPLEGEEFGRQLVATLGSGEI